MKKAILIIIGSALVLGAGYYFIIQRPANIKKQCHEDALESSGGQLTRYNNDQGGFEPNYFYHSKYDACLNENGL